MTAQPRAIEFKPLSELRPDPRNPKAHDLDTLDKSIGRFGVVDPIVQDGRTGYIISGHGRTKALAAREAAGDNPPEGVKVDEEGRWLVPVSTGWASRTDAEAGAALIALNRTTELGGWVDEALLDMLNALEEVEDGLLGVGFTEHDVDALEHLAYEATDEAPVRDLDDLYEEVGDPTHEDSLTRVVLSLTPETAERLLDRVGKTAETQEVEILRLLDRGESL